MGTILEALKELNKITESKDDRERFINKFGEEAYLLFIKYKDRLKNNNISTDMTWHIKHSSWQDLYIILNKIQNRLITKDDNIYSDLEGDYEYLGEGKGYKVYHIKDYIAAINFGVGTGWCISGRYGHYNQPNYVPSQKHAESHFKGHTSQGENIYFCISDTNKYCLRDAGEELDSIVITLTNKENKDEFDDINNLPLNLLPNKKLHNLKYLENEGLLISEDKIIHVDENRVTINIPNYIKYIEDYTFHLCAFLEELKIPESVIYIGEDAFYDCPRLTVITSNPYVIEYCKQHNIKLKEV